MEPNVLHLNVDFFSMSNFIDKWDYVASAHDRKLGTITCH